MLVTACGPRSDDAQFHYASCPTCPVVTTPMMTADEEDVIVTGSIPDEVTVESAGPQIVSVWRASRSCCATNDAGSPACRPIAPSEACAQNERTAKLTITVHASPVTEGWSELLIRRMDGSVWGAVRLTVELAASLGFGCDELNPVTIKSSGSCPVTWSATDANGAPLVSTVGVHLTSSDTTVVTFGVFMSMDANIGGTMAATGVTIEGRQPGDATVTATGGGITDVLPVHVSP